MRVGVVGAGLGGLAAAIAARRAGHDVTVFERAQRLRETGAGIALLPNGVLAMDALGLGDPVRERAASWDGLGGLRDRHGRTLLAIRQQEVIALVGAPFVVVPRLWLHQLLAGALPVDRVRTGIAVHSVRHRGSEVELHTDAGEITNDIVIAADGLGSGLRGQLFPDHPGVRGSGEIAVRAVASVPGLDPAELPAGELLDARSGERFGCMPMATGEVYWYSTWRVPAPTDPDERHAWLLARRRDWHPAVPALIAASAPDALHVDETARLVEPLPSLASGRVALVGDAAHAMMPDLGQGGCQALEDAVALGDLLTGADPGEVEALLRRYDRRRRPRTSQLIAGASRLNRLFGLTGPAAAVRDTLLRLIPAALATRVLARQFRFAG